MPESYPVTFCFLRDVQVEDLSSIERKGACYTLTYGDGSVMVVDASTTRPQLQGVYEREWLRLVAAFEAQK